MDGDILARLRRALPTLSRAEKQAAQWVIANPRSVSNGPIAQVARDAGVSEPTVVRLCRRLGLSGFRELRMLLVVSLRHPEHFLHQDVGAEDAVVDAVGKVLDSSVRALVELRSAAARLPFEAAVKSLQRAALVTFVGVGASGLVARDAQHKFFRLGILCGVATDMQTIVQHAAIAQPGHVFVAVSYSGTWRDLAEAIGVARRNGARVIAITDALSRLAGAADTVFPLQPSEDTNVYTPMSSRLVQLALLDALQVALALALGERAANNLRRSKRALVDYKTDDVAAQALPSAQRRRGTSG